MCVDIFIECLAWSYWWTWCVLLIICNSKHFSFFVIYFNVSDRISSTLPRLLNFQFSISLLKCFWSWLWTGKCLLGNDYRFLWVPNIENYKADKFCIQACQTLSFLIPFINLLPKAFSTHWLSVPETPSKPSQTSMIKFFAKIITG